MTMLSVTLAVEACSEGRPRSWKWNIPAVSWNGRPSMSPLASPSIIRLTMIGSKSDSRMSCRRRFQRIPVISAWTKITGPSWTDSQRVLNGSVGSVR
jgi:hypothetical protein